MADILLIHPPDKKPAALQLAQALAAEGYAATLKETAGGSGLAGDARSARAALLIWSRGLASASVTEGWLAPLRQLPNLIEVTTDSITPNSGDEGHIVLLSGWRGQPYHQGWQRILARLRDIAPAKAASPRPVEAKGAAASAPGTRKAKLGLGAAAALTLAAAVGATAWVGNKAPKVEEVSRPQPAPAAAPAPQPLLQPAASTAPAEAAPPLPAAPVQTASAAPAPKAAVSKPKAESKPRAAAPKPTFKRYTKRGAKKMRKFCARAGRGTAECRTFAYSMAARGD